MRDYAKIGYFIDQIKQQKYEGFDFFHDVLSAISLLLFSASSAIETRPRCFTNLECFKTEIITLAQNLHGNSS